MSLYADDTVFYCGGKNLPTLSEKLNFAADKFQLWCHLNKLTRNIDKSKVVYNNRFPKEVNVNLEIKLNQTVLEVDLSTNT